MVRRTKAEALETRENILQAAAKVFVCKGVANASLDEIAKVAGVTRGAVYWHFKNKNDLFEALHDSVHYPLYKIVLDSLDKDSENPLKQLEDVCISLLLDISKDEQKQRIIKIFTVKCDYSGETESVLKRQSEQMQESINLFEKYFVKAKVKGQIPEGLDPKMLALGLMCYLTGIVNKQLRCPSLINIEKQAKELIHQFFYGISTQRHNIK